MAATDLIKIQKLIADATFGNTAGLEESVTLGDFVGLLPPSGAQVAGSQVLVTKQTAPAAAPAAFADLTAAATAYNAMRTALIAAGVFI